MLPLLNGTGQWQRVAMMRWTIGDGERGPRFTDRRAAGRALATRLHEVQPDLHASSPLILGLPRGGVVVAAEVATALDAPLDVLVVRKLGVPWHPELAFGAIAAGVRVLNPSVASGIGDADIERVTQEETQELLRREKRYRGDRPPLELRGRTVVLVDDGLATGATARAAVAAANAAQAEHVILAVPVAAPDSAQAITDAELVAVALPPDFYAVGQFYDIFDQTTDAEVTRILAEHPRR